MPRVNIVHVKFQEMCSFVVTGCGEGVSITFMSVVTNDGDTEPVTEQFLFLRNFCYIRTLSAAQFLACSYTK